jgi:hypothetical protein
VALTFVAVVVDGTVAAVAPELDELLDPELLELLLLPPLELELLLELPPLELPELLELLELPELLLELPPLELLELDPLVEQSWYLHHQ